MSESIFRTMEFGRRTQKHPKESDELFGNIPSSSRVFVPLSGVQGGFLGVFFVAYSDTPPNGNTQRSTASLKPNPAALFC